MWIEQTEGARFWFAVMNAEGSRPSGRTDRQRAVHAWTGRASRTMESETGDGPGIVHLIRHSLAYAGWKERKPLASALKALRHRRRPRRRARWPRSRPGPGGRCTRASCAAGARRGTVWCRSLRSRRRPACDLHDFVCLNHGAPGDPHDFPNDRGVEADPPGAARGGEQVAQTAALLADGAERILGGLRGPLRGGGVVSGRQERAASIRPCRGTVASIGWLATAKPRVARTRKS